MAKAIDLQEEQDKKDLEKQKDDRCPYCLQLTSSYPYMMMDPMRGWVECAGCGIVFSPKSLRDLKIETATKKIKAPKLLIPS